MVFNKKGVSAVVANVLIILLVVVGVALIWAAVRPAIEDATEDIDSGCLTVSVEPVSCSANSGAGFAVLRRNVGASDVDVTGLRVIHTKNDGTSTTDDIDGSLEELGSVTWTPVSIGSQIVIAAGDSVNVAALIGADKKVCQVTSSPVTCTD
ncbi:MAG: hypothetical protein Q8P57_03750 [Candidatus Pacearchaeota archaeon]|nr:hypothetical protein [Candidatus Pacearchaeota archaeon]